MKKILKNTDKPLLIICTLLFIIGLIMIFSASNITAFMKYSASPYNYFLKQSIFLVISIVASLFIIRFHSKSYHIIFNILVYIIAGMLAFVLLYGSVKNQSIRWIDLGFFSIQPSEFAKIVMLVWVSCYYDKHKDDLDKYMKVFYPLVVAGVVAFLIMIAPDLDTTIIYVLLIASIFFMAPISKEIRNKVLTLMLGLMAVVLLVIVTSGNSILTPGQQARLTNFSNPCSEEKFYSSGNQVCNGYIAINNGGLTGVGLGNSTQKYLYLPEAHTDFIFAIIMEEIGLIGAILIFVLYFLLIGRIIKIAKDSYTTRGFLICMGVAVYIILHIIVNLGGMFGLMPTTGVPLPFMSYGGSFLMCLVFALTFVQRINIENRLYKEKNTKNIKKVSK